VKIPSVDPNNIEALIIDLDGVIWRGETLLPGATPFLRELHARSIPYIFATNNASTTTDQLCRKAHQMGLSIQPEQIITSSQATVSMLAERLPEGAPIYVIGEQGIRQSIKEAAFKITQSADEAQAVVVGMDRKISWEKMAEAAYAIARGVLFLGTNSDPSFPTERGLAPGNGAFLYALQLATNVTPIVVGKPEPYLFLQALKRLGVAAARTLVLGDRLATDIEGGIRAGAMTALVLTGVTSQDDLMQSDIQPDFIFDDLPDLIQGLWGVPRQDNPC
jgi:4-nitrophenyl phosphatase